MARLRIDRVQYFGRDYEFVSPVFENGISILEGPNGVGKTTFFDLVHYALGGAVKEFDASSNRRHVEITGDTDNHVEIYITVGSKGYALRRNLGQRKIGVATVASETERSASFNVFALNRSKNNEYIFSDWMLDNLGVSAIDIYSGAKTFKLNFMDLFRLIYHDQSPNPLRVFKDPDFQTPIAESLMLRKIIFQVWLSKGYTEYYTAIANRRRADDEKSVAKDVLDEYKALARTLSVGDDLPNAESIREWMTEADAQLERLYETRQRIKRSRTTSDGAISDLEATKESLLSLEIKLKEYDDNLLAVYGELSRLNILLEDAKTELGHIAKIIHAHDQLDLFSADTCPFCLTAIDRPSGKCICGSDIDESQYQRFFYSTNEYAEIFERKKSTLETIGSAMQSLRHEEANILADRKDNRLLRSDLKGRLRRNISRIDSDVDVEELDSLDDKILEIREERARRQQQYELASRIDERQRKYDEKLAQAELATNKERELEAKANIELHETIAAFNTEYNSLLKGTLKDVTSARIDAETYLPVINNGEYREASSLVPIRLMYFLSLLRVALTTESIPFPRLLLIDTPETAGIDQQNLIKALEQMAAIGEMGKDFQILLSTGVGKYPESMNASVVLSLSDDNKLLNERSVSNDEL